jgi:hypothetical protein
MSYCAKGLCKLSSDNNTCWHSYILICTRNYNHIALEQKYRINCELNDLQDGPHANPLLPAALIYSATGRSRIA